MAMIPSSINLHRESAVLEICYPNDVTATLPAEYLRVLSPSAEVRGHHPSQARLETGKKHVGIRSLSPVGNYAIQLHFDDGHDTGIYSWDFLWDLFENQEKYWNDYLAKLRDSGGRRDPNEQSIQLFDPKNTDTPSD